MEKIKKFLSQYFNSEKGIEVASGDETGADIKHKGIWSRFFHLCKAANLPYGLLAVYIIAMVLQGVIVIKLPVVSGNFFTGDASVSSVLSFLGIELCSTLTGMFVLYINHMLRYRTNRNLRNALWGKILKLKPAYYDQVSSSTLLSRITIDSDSINAFLLDVVIEVFYQIYLLVLSINEMNQISIRAGFILLAFLPLNLLFSFFMGRLNLKYNNKAAYTMANLTDYLSELVVCLPLLKSCNMQKYEQRRGKKVVDEYYEQKRNLIGVDLLKQVLGAVVGIGPTIAIILMGIAMLEDGTVDAAGWYIFYCYAGTFILFASQMGTFFESVKTIQGQLYKVSDVLYESEEMVGQYVKEIVDSGDICFENVSFSYGDSDNLVIEDASFSLLNMKNNVIIGHSGCGKSTSLKLLERIYQPVSGRIMVNGNNIEDYQLKNWRSNIAYVNQNTPLMSGTIRENILYGIKHEVSDEKIMEACKLANLDEFIKENKDGLDYQVGQFGEKLSGGQKQKIAIARAILKDASILVLDEPTASLDIPSTFEITETVKSLTGKYTLIIVTHDEKLIDLADQLIVFEDDHVVNSGDKEELRKYSPFMASMSSEAAM